MPRGPDVQHKVNVKRSWLLRGETIELTLPRNLACAACKGGGCDRCERSGAITLRPRGVDAVPIKVPLPRRSTEDLAREPSVVLRIPEQGGEPSGGVDLPRGLLLLQIVVAERADAGVAKVRTSIARRLSGRPPQPEPAREHAEAPESTARARPSSPDPSSTSAASSGWLLVFVMLAVAWAALTLLFSARLPR